MRQFVLKHREKITYLFVGGWNTVFGYGVFALLYYLFSQRLHALMILVVSYVLSITNAYIGYRIVVFRSSGGVLREYLRFCTVYGGAFLFNIVLLPLFMNVLLFNAYASQALITVLTVLGSYVLHRNYTFR